MRACSAVAEKLQQIKELHPHAGGLWREPSGRPIRMMKRLLHRIAALAATSLFLAAAAAPVVPGEPSRITKAAAHPVLRLSAAAHVAAVELPPVTDEELSSLRASNRRNAFKPNVARRVNIGLVRDVPATQEAAAARTLEWREVPGGRAARVAVTSPSAAAMRLAIDLTGVPDTVEMVFFGMADPARLEGPIRVGDLRDRTRPFWTPITEGDTQSVELFAPEGTPAFGGVRMASASHLLAAPSAGLDKRLGDIGLAGSCNVDVTCSPLDATAGFRNADEAVAQMVFVEGGFTTLCTGTLLADSDTSTQVPWFFTANHCFENASAPYKTPAQMQTVADSVTTIWGFQASSCGARTPRADWAQVGGGATWLYNDPRSDALFLRLSGTPPGYAYYAGWDANALGAGTGITAIHHPEGDLKKVSQGTLRGLVTLASGPGPGGGSFAEVAYSSGTTEPGSSGAGLFTSASTPGGLQYYLRGALWGGTASCTVADGTDDYSRFDLVYPSLARWLGTGAKTVGPTTDYTDLWWAGPAEDGWGLNLVQHDSIVFGLWYTYDTAGQRTWFNFSSGTWTATDTYEGTLYAVTGPPQTGPFDPNAVVRTPVGPFTLTFSDANNGTFRWTVNGQSGTKPITRFRF
jgi:lysyl endopeptidase